MLIILYPPIHKINLSLHQYQPSLIIVSITWPLTTPSQDGCRSYAMTAMMNYDHFNVVIYNNQSVWDDRERIKPCVTGNTLPFKMIGRLVIDLSHVKSAHVAV